MEFVQRMLKCVPDIGAEGERLRYWYSAYLVQKETDADRKPPHRLNRRSSTGSLPMPSAQFKAPPKSDHRKSLHTAIALDREDLLRQIFAMCDDDKTGFLSVQEFQQLATKDDARSMSMQAAVFAMVDANADGKLSADEFVQHNLASGEALADAEFEAQAAQWKTLADARIKLG